MVGLVETIMTACGLQPAARTRMRFGRPGATRHDGRTGGADARPPQAVAQAKTPHEQESLQRQIAATDKSIDALVYELYGLTEEETQIVEGERR